MTVTFQHGNNGYVGGKSVDISSLNLGNPGGYGQNGTTFGDGNSDWCIGLLSSVGGYGYDISPLISFTELNLPTGAVVTGARLTLHFVEWDRPATVRGRYLNVEWDPNVIDPNGGTTNAAVGWRYRMTGVAWSTLGALGDGTDTWAGRTFSFPALTANGAQSLSADLDPQVVQHWVDHPQENFGVILQVQETGIHVYFTQNQRPTVSSRPLLEITYHL